MKNVLFAFVLGLSVAVFLPVHAQEKIVLGTPVVPPTPPTLDNFTPVTFTVTRLVAGYSDKSSITIGLAPTASNGTPIAGGALSVFSYPDASVSALDTEAEVAALVSAFKSVNLSTAYTGANSGNLWQRVQFFLCRDFPGRFNGGCTVQ